MNPEFLFKGVYTGEPDSKGEGNAFKEPRKNRGCLRTTMLCPQHFLFSLLEYISLLSNSQFTLNKVVKIDNVM